MESDKLRQIIADKNEQRERVALRTAENIIEEIVKAQGVITATASRIAELREELAKLQVEQLDAAAILGGQ